MRILAIILGMTMCVTLGHAQNNNNHKSAFNKFREEIKKDFDDFRRQIIEEYTEFLANPWKEEKREKPVPKPKDESVPPVVMPKKEREEMDVKPTPIKPIVIKEVVKPVVVTPQPEPVAPIEIVPVQVEKKVRFKFFGTEGSVSFDNNDRIQLGSVSERDVADAFARMAEGSYDNIVKDCLKIREKLQLCDWAYLQMLHSMAGAVCGAGTNEATLLMAYVYCMSGYKMRFASDNSRLYMLYASRHHIYNKSYFNVDGENYYPFGDVPASLFISHASFKKEQSQSLWIPKEQLFDMNEGETIVRSSRRYPEVKTTVYCNKNLMDFYSSYPTSIIGDDVCSRWAMYADTPLQTDIKEQIYPTLKSAIKGKTEHEAVNILLNYVQTGFTYGYDNEVWGGDRAFFAEESLFYPYSDCEDHSILFTRLVRDLVGLDCLLVYYPGHLASAVCFSDGKAHGDYISLNGRLFTIADATYENAPVGCTMPKMDNTGAKVILLKR